MKHKLTIVWGSDIDVDDPEIDKDEMEERTITYEFKATGELNAFLAGETDAAGWNGYTVTAANVESHTPLGEYTH